MTETMVRRLYELACTPFLLSKWQERWSSYGWSFDPEPSEPYAFQVTLPEGIALRVHAEDDRVTAASLPFYFWEEFSPEDHEDPAEFSRQKKAFDAGFDDAAAVAARLLPEPFLQWRDQDERAHRAVAWQGTEGILILQQASVDPQFGLEVDFWLTQGRRQDFHPETPLIDWLSRLE